MERMYFRNYSITCYGPCRDLPKLLTSISEGRPVILDSVELMVASFISAMRLDEIETLLKDKNYSFMIFEMDPDTSRGHLIDKGMQQRLFDDFFYKKIGLEDLNNLTPNFSGTNEYIDYEDIGSSKVHSEIYLQDLLETLQEAISDEEYEYAGEVRDEIKEVDPEFYEKNVKNNKFLG